MDLVDEQHRAAAHGQAPLRLGKAYALLLAEPGAYRNTELVAEIRQTAQDYPDIVSVFSIGKSYQGRDIWMAKVSDNVATDENEPEVLVDALHHAREHLTTEQSLALLRWLTRDYGSADAQPGHSGAASATGPPHDQQARFLSSQIMQTVTGSNHRNARFRRLRPAGVRNDVRKETIRGIRNAVAAA